MKLVILGDISHLNFIQFASKHILQSVGISMKTNYASITADILLYSYEARFLKRKPLGITWNKRQNIISYLDIFETLNADGKLHVNSSLSSILYFD
jgi:hypothetical protein